MTPSRDPHWAGAPRLALALILLLTVLRLAYMLSHEPLAGFANQFDMLRTTACVGLRPGLDVPYGQATPAAPVAIYSRDAGGNESCLPGTEVALVAALLQVDALAGWMGIGDPQTLSLRWIAWGKGLILLAALFWGQWQLRRWPLAALAHAAVSLLVLTDPFNTLYLAGFYTEISALLSAYLLLMLPLLWLLRGSVPGWPGVLGLSLILAALLLARFQHVLIPVFALGALLWMARHWQWPRLRLALAALPLMLALGLQLHWQQQQTAIAAANRINSFFGAALPASADAGRMLQRLGLDASCGELVHVSWYMPRGRDVLQECPQAMQLSRLRWSLALAQEPAALLRMFARGVALAAQWRPGYLGELAGLDYQRMPPGRLALGASVADAVAAMPYLGQWWLWAGPLLWLPLAWRRDSNVGRARARRWLASMLAFTVLSGWLSSVIGDGYSEVGRHLHLAANAALVAGLLGLADLLGLLRARGWTEHKAALASCASLALLLALPLPWVLRNQALAFGFLETPATDVVAAGPLQLSGWALDPNGIAGMDLVDSDGARYPLQLLPFPELAIAYGTASAATAVRYSALIDGPLQPPVAIVVTSHSGTQTVIDRRWLRVEGRSE